MSGASPGPALRPGFARRLGWALAGAALGWLGIVLLALGTGFAILFLLPFFVLLLLAAGVLAALCTAVLSSWAALARRGTITAGAVLTVVLYLAWPVYLMLFNTGGGGGPLFG